MINRVIEKEQYDAIYVHLFRMAQFVINRKDQYRILDLTDVISNEIGRSIPYRNIFWKLMYSIEYSRIAQQERKLANQFEEVWLVSDTDQKILASQAPKANIITVTNGIDTQIFHPVQVERVPHRLIFTGHMGVSHNVDAARFFALEIFPGIQAIFPESNLIIAGAEPSDSVITLSRCRNVRVLGFVEDLNEELNRSQVFIAPLRYAAGIQNKVLEAMAAGIPVVTTRIVNEGINAKEDVEILIADTPDEYFTQIKRLFNDESLRNKIGLAGLNFVRRNFSWDIVLERMNELEATHLHNRNQAKSS